MKVFCSCLAAKSIAKRPLWPTFTNPYKSVSSAHHHKLTGRIQCVSGRCESRRRPPRPARGWRCSLPGAVENTGESMQGAPIVAGVDDVVGVIVVGGVLPSRQ